MVGADHWNETKNFLIISFRSGAFLFNLGGGNFSEPSEGARFAGLVTSDGLEMVLPRQASSSKAAQPACLALQSLPGQQQAPYPHLRPSNGATGRMEDSSLARLTKQRQVRLFYAAALLCRHNQQIWFQPKVCCTTTRRQQQVWNARARHRCTGAEHDMPRFCVLANLGVFWMLRTI